MNSMNQLWIKNMQPLSELIKYKKPRQKNKIYIKYLFLFTLISGFFVPYIPEYYRYDVIRGSVLLLFLIYFLINKHHFDFISKVIILFSLYILIMALVTYIKYNVYSTVAFKIFISSIYYIIGYNFINTKDNMLYLSKIYFLGFFILVSVIILLNILGVKPINLYTNMEEVYLGSQGVNTTKLIPFFIFPSILYFLYARNVKNRITILVIVTISIILMMIAQKRGAVLGLGFGIMTYLFLSPRKGKIFNIVTAIFVISLISYPLYIDTVITTWEVRKDRFSVLMDPNDAALQKEQRYIEVQRTINDFMDRSALEILAGTGFKSELYRYDTNRIVHTDYIMFLDGTGALGLFIYIFIYILIFYKTRKYSRYFKNDSFILNIYAIVISMTVAILFTAISGSSHSLDIKAVYFLYVGAALGFFSNNFSQKYGHKNAYNNIR